MQLALAKASLGGSVHPDGAPQVRRDGERARPAASYPLGLRLGRVSYSLRSVEAGPGLLVTSWHISQSGKEASEDPIWQQQSNFTLG